MSHPRIRRVSTRRELDRAIEDYCVQGFEIVDQSDTSALVKRKSWGTPSGHFLCFLFTFWFTLGFGNLIYALLANANGDKVLLDLEEEEGPVAVPLPTPAALRGVTCPSCGKGFGVPSGSTGAVACPHCSTRLSIRRPAR